jgi:hypothetical protein
LLIATSELPHHRRKAGRHAGLFVGHIRDQAFITHSQNKSRGTGNRTEHRTRRFVVGAGNANT